MELEVKMFWFCVTSEVMVVDLVATGELCAEVMFADSVSRDEIALPTFASAAVSVSIVFCTSVGVGLPDVVQACFALFAALKIF
jgi:phage-related holin